jgi:hypothetical protein
VTEFRVTFGLHHEQVPHPNCGWVHPGGWLTIEAPNEELAREGALITVGRTDPDNPRSAPAFAFIYDMSKPENTGSMWEAFTRGELMRVVYSSSWTAFPSRQLMASLEEST